MQSFRIFTESRADIKFLKDYIEDVFSVTLPDNKFDPLGSWAGYKSAGEPKASIKENQANANTTILILDADTDFEDRQQDVLKDFSDFGIPVSLFLFPNNQVAGSLETLLCEIATERKIINCFEQYESCITGYEAPVVKSKVFAYLDALLPANQKKGNIKDLIKEENRNYRSRAHWNLNHPFLQPLKEFLQPFLSQ